MIGDANGDANTMVAFDGVETVLIVDKLVDDTTR
jgi:hypothetical protein